MIGDPERILKHLLTRISLETKRKCIGAGHSRAARRVFEEPVKRSRGGIIRNTPGLTGKENVFLTEKPQKTDEEIWFPQEQPKNIKAK